MSYDLPEGSKNQRSVRPLTGSYLEQLGKEAAARWGRIGGSLTDSVAGTIKHANATLSPEQVKRVVEFANVNAYLSEFRKEGTHKIVDFGEAGPANVADVLRDMNDGGEAVTDLGISDYSRVPEKRAHAQEDDHYLAEAFSVRSSVSYPEHDPLSDVITLRDKVAGDLSHTCSELSSMEVLCDVDLTDRLYSQVKHAAMAGISLGEVVQAWSSVSNNPAFVKEAFDRLVPRLLRDGVFSTAGAVGDSIVKTAGVRYVNKEHPLVRAYADFCEGFSKLAELYAARQELTEAAGTLNTFLSEFAKTSTVAPPKTLSETMSGAAKSLTEGAQKHLGLGDLTSKAVGYGTVYGIPALAAYGAGQYVKDLADDTGVTRHIPGTQQNDYMRAQRLGAV